MKESQGILAKQSRRGNKILTFQGNIRARHIITAPKTHPHAISGEVRCQIIRLRTDLGQAGLVTAQPKKNLRPTYNALLPIS